MYFSHASLILAGMNFVVGLGVALGATWSLSTVGYTVLLLWPLGFLCITNGVAISLGNSLMVDPLARRPKLWLLRIIPACLVLSIIGMAIVCVCMLVAGTDWLYGYRWMLWGLVLALTSAAIYLAVVIIRLPTEMFFKDSSVGDC